MASSVLSTLLSGLYPTCLRPTIYVAIMMNGTAASIATATTTP